MSDQWPSESGGRERRGNPALTVVVILLLLNAGFTVFIFAYSNHYVGELRSYLTELRTEKSQLESRLSALDQEIQSLRSQIVLGGGNNTSELVVLPKIYNLTRYSVVLIKSRLSGSTAQGSGFVYDKAGYILTNYHVVQDALSIEVTFIDGTVTQATVVGTDPYSDIAVVRVNVSSSILHPLPLGDSSELQVGETVIAIGNPYGLSNSMTVGIVSQLERELSAPGSYIIVDVIQTDAAINKGNSGGPMLNLDGEVVGMNTAILTMTGEWQGIGFAIPSDTIRREVPELIQTGSYAHPLLGVQGTDLTPEIAHQMGLSNSTRGALIVAVTSGGPSVGILRGGTRTVTISGREVKIGGDVIIEVEGQRVLAFYDVVLYIERNLHPNDQVTFKILRGTETLTVDITLGTRPAP